MATNNKSIIRIAILLLGIIMLFHGNSYSDVAQNDINYAKNYLIILVHGIGDDYTCFDKLKLYLEDNGLTGYVYAYSFSDRFLKIEKEGWEFGNRNYSNPASNMNGLCWLEKAKEDFKTYIAKHSTFESASNVPNSLVPQKFIVIAHSMGGLAVRSYILGKNQNNQRYYQNDIEKVIYVDTPHKGSGAASYVTNFENASLDSFSITMSSLGLAYMFGFSGNDYASKLFAGIFAFSLMSSDITLAIMEGTNRFKTPALDDLVPNSQFLKELNDANFGNYSPIRQYVIVGRGVPTPMALDKTGFLATKFNPISLIIAGLGNILANPNLTSFEGRFTAAYATMLTAYPMFEEGDVAVESYSQRAEGIANVNPSRKAEYTFSCPGLSALEFGTLPWIFKFLPPPAKVACYISAAFIALDGMGKLGEFNPFNYMTGHIRMPSVILNGEPNLIDQMLFEENQPSGSSSTHAVHSASLTLSSNLTREAGTIRTLSSFHVVSPEAMTESRANASILPTPIIVDGQEKRMETITVKEPPTRIEGVLRDFMPLKMQYFQYSENFAAWKNINVLNEWGDFRIDNLKLAEGQNVIAFRAKNKVGYESNQHLKIILNTIPMLIQNMLPAPSTYIRNNLPEISGEFSKSVYVTNTTPGQGIPDITSAWLYKNEAPFIDLLKDPNFKVEYVKVNDYKTAVKFSWKAVSPLEDGKYQVRVSAKSEVGSSQGAWMFWVDTKAPTITFTIN